MWKGHFIDKLRDTFLREKERERGERKRQTEQITVFPGMISAL